MPDFDPSTHPDWCSVASAGEPVAGTAAHQQVWVLLETPGNWGRDVLDGENLGTELADRLGEHLAQAGARLLFVRRPGREGAHPTQGVRRFAVCDTRPGRRRVRAGEVAEPGELLDMDLSGGGLVGAREVTAPLALVCTHGRRDRCCAARGRPVAARLAADSTYSGDADDPVAGVWECSHTGGHRFAPVLLLPATGYTYGSAAVEDYAEAVRSAADGRVALRGLRGRSTWTPAGQVAEIAVRDSGVHAGVDDLRVRGRTDPEPSTGVERVVVDHADGRSWRVVTGRRESPAAPASCGKPAKAQQAWTVEALERV